MTIVVVSGGFDPVHIGHIEYIKQAKLLGDKLVVILNSDEFLINKKGYIFMPYNERKVILESIKYVDDVIPCFDNDETVSKTLLYLKPDIFAKGGDRTYDNIPQSEKDICNKLGIKLAFGIGGEKLQSSSELVKCLNEKRWGYYNILLQGKGFWFKKLVFDDSNTSLQSHKMRDEIWLIYVPSGTKHKITGTGEVLELAIGTPQEEDIIRE